MPGWLTEKLKIDPANTYMYQILATPAPGIRSRYYSLRNYSKIVFAFIVDTIAAAAAVVATVNEATDAVGTGAQGIAGATCTIVGNVAASVCTIVCTTVLNTEYVTINGLRFTGAAAPDLPNHVFDRSGGDAATAASLAAAINHAAAQAHFITAAYGGAAITAAVLAGQTVTLWPTEAGVGSLTIVSHDATMVVATVEAIGTIELESTALTAVGGFDHVSLQLVGAATSHAAILAIRGGESRYQAVTQSVAATDTDT
jgi:hypothetical protein